MTKVSRFGRSSALFLALLGQSLLFAGVQPFVTSAEAGPPSETCLFHLRVNGYLNDSPTGHLEFVNNGKCVSTSPSATSAGFGAVLNVDAIDAASSFNGLACFHRQIDGTASLYDALGGSSIGSDISITMDGSRGSVSMSSAGWSGTIAFQEPYLAFQGPYPGSGCWNGELYADVFLVKSS